MTPDLRHKLLDGFPIVLAIEVAWGEMDAYGHVNNANYFRYAETGRFALLRSLDFVSEGIPTGVGAILHSTRCRFRIPVTYPDRLLVGTAVTDVATDRFTTPFRIVSTRHDAVAAEGDGVVVTFDYGAGRKVAIPDDLRQRIGMLAAPRRPA